ncbi:MAG: hypothetical protein M3Z37_11075 [Candidatus Eremiobacteraeota bacterium]|nr:hypothetical protein [Candidatus Eremiobacteraeota bacterium]
MSWLLLGAVAAAGLAGLLALRSALRAGTPRNIGQDAPQIRASAARQGEAAVFDLREALKAHAVVLYFFPQAFSAG